MFRARSRCTFRNTRAAATACSKPSISLRDASGGGPLNLHPHTDAVRIRRDFARLGSSGSEVGNSWEQNSAPPKARGRGNSRFSEEFWRRRPDLNRGWRFCRQGRDAYPVDSSCFLVGPTLSFFLVLGRYCSQIVPESDGALESRRSKSPARPRALV
jgi:hypothetical protein